MPTTPPYSVPTWREEDVGRFRAAVSQAGTGVERQHGDALEAEHRHEDGGEEDEEGPTSGRRCG